MFSSADSRRRVPSACCSRSQHLLMVSCGVVMLRSLTGDPTSAGGLEREVRGSLRLHLPHLRDGQECVRDAARPAGTDGAPTGGRGKLTDFQAGAEEIFHRGALGAMMYGMWCCLLTVAAWCCIAGDSLSSLPGSSARLRTSGLLSWSAAWQSRRPASSEGSESDASARVARRAISTV